MKFWKRICDDFYTEKGKRPTWHELAIEIGNCDAEMIREFAKKEANKSAGAEFYFKLVERASNPSSEFNIEI